MKIPRMFSLSLLALATLLTLAPSGGIASTYLEIPGINGQQDTPGHPDVILVNSYSFFGNDFTVTKAVDSASAALFLATVNGTHFPTMNALFYNIEPPAGAPDSTYIFTDVFISSYTSLGTAGEEVTFNFDTVVPEPASLSLLALSGGALLLRRRA